MKVLGTVLKIVAALAAVAGIIYVAATYGDKIVAWAKKMLGKLGCCGCCDEAAEVADSEIVETEEAPEAEEGAVQAEENDFEG